MADDGWSVASNSPNNDWTVKGATPDNGWSVRTPASTPGATGLGMLGETWNDLTGGKPPQHAPNALEQGIMDVSSSPIMKGLRGSFMQGVTNGPIMNGIPSPIRVGMALVPGGQNLTKAIPVGTLPGDVPGVRDVMEQSNYGRQPGETDQAFHQRYNDALTLSRQQADAEGASGRVGSYGPNATMGQRAQRFGQQVLNTGASIVSNPEYFLAPGAGGASVLGRVVRAGVSNAAIGGASDAAAQLMDVAQGQKKDFDIQQNLQATLLGGAFGAGLHTATEVAPFVKGLFGTRGVDTTPQADPRTSMIQPMTTDHIQLNAADHMQYQHLLNTGSVDDIKGFFQGRNGPQPSWTEVNDWVSHRDNPPVAVNGQAGVDPTRQPDFNYEQSYNDHAEQQYREQNRQAVEDHVNNKMAGWANAPNVEVVHSPSDIADPEIRDQVVKQDKNGDALGVYGSDGVVRMFSGRITDPDTASAVIYHEGLGHYGLFQKFGDRLSQVLQSLLDRNVNQLARDTAIRQKANPGESRLISAEEVLAERSQNGQMPSSWQNAVSSTVRQFGRKMGLKNLAYSDAEVNHILAMAHDAVINGKPSARANGFRGAVQGPNKFMFVGQKSTGFDPHDAGTFRASDGQLRSEISDHNSVIKQPIHPEKLPDVLDHPELYRKYPELRDVNFRRIDDPRYNEGINPLAKGHYDTETKTIYGLHPEDPDIEGSIHHEVQHAIQDIEQYPDFVAATKKGGSDSIAKVSADEYWSHPSEVEARHTEDRLNDTMRERDANPIKFMRANQLKPKDVAEEAFDRLGNDYSPTTRSWEDSMEMAKNTALNLDALKNVRSVGNLDKRLFQYDNAAKELNSKLMAAAEKVVNGEELTAEEHAEQIRNVAQFHYALGRIENDSSQVGRALNAMKAIEFSRNNLLRLNSMLSESDTTLSGLTDPDTMQKFLRQYQLLGNTKGGQTLVRDVSKPGWEKYALALYRNMLLSGLGTHIKAPMDMATGIALDLEDRLGAIPIGKIHDALNALGLTKQGGIHGRESLGYVFGMLKAITDGEAWSKAMAALKDPHAQTIRMSKEAPAVLPGMAGKITSFPTRLISAQDAFFRAISTNAHLYGDGVARSLATGDKDLTWSDHLTRGGTYAANPSDSARLNAEERANKALLLSDNPLTNFLERGKQVGMVRSDAIKQQIADRAQNSLTKANESLSKDPQNSTLIAARDRATKRLWQANRDLASPDILDRAITSIIDLFTPIIRVPANSLLTRVVARSPLSFLDPETRSMFKAGGRQADIALSRTLVGTMKLAMYWTAANVAGDYFNPDKRKEKEATGWRPDSVKEGNTFLNGNELAASINPMDLHNSTATMVADVHEAYKAGANHGQVGTALALAGSRVMHDMFNEVWMGDLAKASGMFNDSPASNGSAARTLGRVAASTVVPSAIAQFRATTDPYQRETTDPDSGLNTVANMIENRIPGVSGNLPLKYSVYGDPMPTGSNLVNTHNVVTGGNHTTEDTDPTKQELERLSDITVKDGERVVHDGANALITPVKGVIAKDPMDSSQGTIKLTAAQKAEYQRLAGQTIVYYVKQSMDGGSWNKASDAQRIDEIRSIQSDAKKDAADAIRERFYPNAEVH